MWHKVLRLTVLLPLVLILFCTPKHATQPDHALLQSLSPRDRVTFLRTHRLLSKLASRAQLDHSLTRALARKSTLSHFTLRKKSLGYIVKKRLKIKDRDETTWKIASLLSLGSYVAPALTQEMNGDSLSLSPWLNFRLDGHSSYLTASPQPTLKDLPLHEFWKGLLLAYLLDFDDLWYPNLAVSPSHTMIFFDNDRSLQFEPSHLPFASTAFDWEHFATPLSRKSCRKLELFIKTLESNFEGVHTYCNLKHLDFYPHIQQRLEKIKAFPLQEGEIFQNFLFYLYPHFKAELPKLEEITQQSRGSALFIAKRHLHLSGLSKEKQQEVTHWLERQPILDH